MSKTKICFDLSFSQISPQIHTNKNEIRIKIQDTLAPLNLSIWLSFPGSPCGVSCAPSCAPLCQPSCCAPPPPPPPNANSWPPRTTRLHGSSWNTWMSWNARIYGTNGTYGPDGTSWSTRITWPCCSSPTVSTSLPSLDNHHPPRWWNASGITCPDWSMPFSVSTGWLLLPPSSSSSCYAPSSPRCSTCSSSSSATTTMSRWMPFCLLSSVHAEML